MTSDELGFQPDDKALYFLPLGGAGEIGMNLNLYGHAGKWLMVDLGISFGDESMPGVDVIMADPAFIRQRSEDLVGLVLTHAHEDHLGAVQYLWAELGCPIYTTPFTAAVLRSKIHERGLVGRIKIHEVPASGQVTIGPFEIEMVGVTHSVPEAQALVIRTAAGTAVHTGDWKLDPRPVVGPTTNEQVLARIGDQGVCALLGDSTNAMVPGHSGSESDVRACLEQLFGQFTNRIVVTCFATNVSRLESVAVAAERHGRRVGLVGRSLWRIFEAARSVGYLKKIPEFLSEHDVAYLPRNQAVLVCTGSQGEPRSALARLASGDHPQVSLEPGDVVIFSSRDIPGNETAVANIQNQLVRRGIEVITSEQMPVHVSGHPARDELALLYHLLRPKVAAPIHGERRHLIEHARLAQECQVPQTIIPENGTILRLAPGPAEAVGVVHTGRLAVDGKRLIPLDAGVMKTRHRIMHNGAAFVTVVVNSRGELTQAPKVAVMGLLDEQAEPSALLDAIDAVREAVAHLPKTTRLEDDDALRQEARTALRRCFQHSHGKKPQTVVHLIRV
ncbi:Ribonuclease J [Azospirillaceae bacterium]